MAENSNLSKTEFQNLNLKNLKADFLTQELESRLSTKNHEEWGKKFQPEGSFKKTPAFFVHYPFQEAEKFKSDLEPLFQHFLTQFSGLWVEKYNFTHPFSNILLQIHNQQSWLKKHTPLPKEQNLPAAKSVRKEKNIACDLLWPDPLTMTTSLSIHSLRLFLSEIFGASLFQFFGQRLGLGASQKKSQGSEIPLLPKAELCQQLLLSFRQESVGFSLPVSLQKGLEELGSQFSKKPEQKKILGEKDFLEKIHQKDPPPSLVKIAETAFQEWKGAVHQQPEKFCHELLAYFYFLAKKHLLISPEEKISLDFLYQKKDLSLLKILQEKLRLCSTTCSLVQNLFREKTKSPQEEQTPEEKDFNLKKLSSYFLKTNKALSFLKPDEFCSEEEKKEKKIFPFLLHQKFFEIFEPLFSEQKISPQKWNLYLLQYYEKQPYQKLYSLCFFALLPPKTDPKYLVLQKNLESWLKHEEERLRLALNFLNLSEEVWGAKWDERNCNFEQNLQAYERAWKLFLGTAIFITEAKKIKQATFLPLEKVRIFEKIVKEQSLQKLTEKIIQKTTNLSQFWQTLLFAIYFELDGDWQAMLSLLKYGCPQMEIGLYQPLPENYFRPEKIFSLAKILAQGLQPSDENPREKAVLARK